MSSARIPSALREQVRKSAKERCCYCRLPEAFSFFPHEVDHVVAEQHGGQTIEGNLCLACLQCNRRKGPNLSSIDPESGKVVQLFHPCLEDWGAHFLLDGARIVGKTPTGRATVRLLEFNAAARLNVREALLTAGVEL